MPLSSKGKKVLKKFKDEYGSKKGEGVFYATENKGKLSKKLFKKKRGK